jgi:type IV pilus assembly protein PilM
MATPRFAWGIDVGNRALKAVKLISTAEGLVIDDFDVIEHDTVLSASGDNRDSLIQAAIATFVARHPGIEKGLVGVGVMGQQSFSRFVKLPPVEDKKIPEIVRFEAIQQIPFPLDEVEWSYQLFREPESPDVEVGIFAMRKELINQHIKFFTDAKLNVQVVQMNPLSVYNAMYYDSRIKGTTMIVDIGADNTDLIIAEGETIWQRSISIGGNSFTEALSRAFKADFAKGEDLKRSASTNKYGRQIMQAMRPIFSDLVSEIQRSMGFYASVHKESRISKVIAVGSTFRLPGLQKYLSQNLTLDVEKLDHLGTGAMEDPKMAALFSENLLSAAGAYGLALQVMGQGKINSSLLPERIRREKMWSEKVKWFAAAAALFVAGAAIPYGRYYFDNAEMSGSDATAANQNITSVLSSARSLDGQWTENVQSKGAAERQQLMNVMQLADGRNLWPQINSLIYDSLPQFGPDAPKELQSNNPDEIKKIPRGQRNQIIITDMVSRYYPDVTPMLAPGFRLEQAADLSAIAAVPTTITQGANGEMGGSPFSGGLGGPGGVPGAPVATHRGFVLTLKVTTPSQAHGLQGGISLIANYTNTLMAAQAGAHQPFDIEAATIQSRLIIGQDQNRQREIGAAYEAAQRAKIDAARAAANGSGSGGGGYPPPFPGGPGLHEPGMPPGGPDVPPPDAGNFPGFAGNGGNANKIPDEAFLDPVLKEDIRGDTEAVVVLLVVLDPADKAKPAPKTVALAPSIGEPVPR